MNQHCYLLVTDHYFFCTILLFMLCTLHLMKCISRTNFNTVTIIVLKLKEMKVMLSKFIFPCYSCTNFGAEYHSWGFHTWWLIHIDCYCMWGWVSLLWFSHLVTKPYWLLPHLDQFFIKQYVIFKVSSCWTSARL